MKFYSSIYASCIAALFAASSAYGAINVTFAGGGGNPVSITLPAISWEVTDAAAFNPNAGLGIGIAVGQSPALVQAGDSIGGSPDDWSSTGSLTFSSNPSGRAFYPTNNFGGPNNGGIIWFGITHSQNAVNGDTIVFDGGTFSHTAAAGLSYINGNYEVYLIGGQTGQAVSSAGVAVPEPSTYAALAGLLAFGIVARRHRRVA
ncbi:MAG: PEP-CTERM sorting domain-containing protein [Verrucomicrobiota bacterium]